MAYENLLVDVSDRIATITINRPKSLNALNRATSPLLDPESVMQLVANHFGVSVDEMLAHRKNSGVKPVLAKVLTRDLGLNQRDAASYMGLTSGAAVCLQLKWLREDRSGEMQQDYEEISRILNI